MAAFTDVKKDQTVYGIVFGKGKIKEVFGDSFYKFIVIFENGYEVPYTEDGIPGWGHFEERTLFYPKDIDLAAKLLLTDHKPINKILTSKEIVALKKEGALEVRTPSGSWANTEKCETSYVELLLEDLDNTRHFFRMKR